LTKTSKCLITLGIVGVVTLMMVSTIDGLTRGGGYDSTRHWVSLLSLGDRAWLGTADLLVSGVLVAMSGAGFSAALRGRDGANWTGRWIGLVGVSLVLAGLFPIDAVQGYPTDAPALPMSWSGRVHSVAGTLLLVSLAATCFVGARLFSQPWSSSLSIRTRTVRLRPVARRATLLGGWSITASVALCCVLVSVSDEGNWESAYAGAFQRLSMLIGSTWIVALGVVLLTVMPGQVDAASSAAHQSHLV
jgi:Protein of unknown function (DUF998)